MSQAVEGATYNGKALFGSTNSFETSLGTVDGSIGSISLDELDITNEQSIEDFMQNLGTIESQIGSNSIAMNSSIDALGATLTSSSAARSQLEDTDIAEAVNDISTQEIKMEAATLAQVHKTDMMKDQLQRLLG